MFNKCVKGSVVRTNPLFDNPQDLTKIKRVQFSPLGFEFFVSKILAMCDEKGSGELVVREDGKKGFVMTDAFIGSDTVIQMFVRIHHDDGAIVVEFKPACNSDARVP